MCEVPLFKNPPWFLLASKIQSKFQNLVFLPFINKPAICILHIMTFSGFLHHQYSNQALPSIDYNPHILISVSFFTNPLSAMPSSSPLIVHLFHKYPWTIPGVSPCEYQGVILPLDGLAPGPLKSSDSYKASPSTTTSVDSPLVSWPEVTVRALHSLPPS